MYPHTKGLIMQEPFNPSSFFTILTVKEIELHIEPLKKMNFKHVPLNKELIKYNYEIVSPDYKDFMYETLQEYYHFEVDTVI